MPIVLISGDRTSNAVVKRRALYTNQRLRARTFESPPLVSIETFVKYGVGMGKFKRGLGGTLRGGKDA